MPRAADIYTLPPGIEGVTNATIESGDWNTYTADVAYDLNAPRPIVAGGTGATNAVQARINLQVEKAAAQVTNYDSHVFETGSFWSSSSATAEPVDGGTFAGHAVILNNDPASIILHATDQVTGFSYTRSKLGGVWGAWKRDGIDDYVNVTGDTMTGGLTIGGALVVSDVAGITASAGPANISGAIHAGYNTTLGRVQFGSTGTNLLQHTGTQWEMSGTGSLTFAGGNIVLSTHGISLGGVIATGLYSDGLTIGLRAFGASGEVHLSSASGGTNYGAFSPLGLTVAGRVEAVNASGNYNYRAHGLGAREWGIAVLSSGNVGYDDITGAKQVAQFTAWSGARASLLLPNIGTTPSAANVHIAAGELYQVTSSIRYKTDVKPLEKGDADKLLLLEPITYKAKSAPTQELDYSHLGFIAEQVAEIEPRLVIWDYLPEDWIEEQPIDADGKSLPVVRSLREGAVKVPDGLAYDRISVLAVFKAKEQEARINAQAELITELTGKIDALVARIEALEAKAA